MDSIKDRLQFRIGATEDSGDICALVNSVYRGENSKKGWTTEADLLDGIRITTEKVNEILQTENHAILLMLLNKKIIGCVHLQKKKSKCHLGMLSVDVDFQNKGIGKILITKSEDYAKTVFDCDEMEMKVIGQRTELVEYYQRRGYILTGEKEDFVMGKHFGALKVKDLYFVYMVKKL
jgi:ribosomal protein S18 acetylase RimI-like enzyme